MAIVAFVPARGGSKSIPLKNIKEFCGKPLIYWNLRALHDVPEINEIIVATDSDLIESKVNTFNFKKVKVFRRSSENASDTASTESVVLEFLDKAKGSFKDDDLFILSQLTNPFTSSLHFKQALSLLDREGKDSLLSCVRFKRFFWRDDGTPWNYDFRLRPRRQDFNGLLLENGAFYINRVGNILRDKNRLSGNISIYEMPEFTQFEIDEPNDWIVAEQLFRVANRNLISEITTEQLKKIKIFLSDVDGVLTDGGMYYSERGDEMKKFNTRDGKGFELLRNAGIKTGVITTESTDIVVRRAKKLKLDFVYQGLTNRGKLDAILEVCNKENCNVDQVAYIGDDINCMEALKAVGLAACPSNASKEIKSIPGILILESRGGEGVFREFVDFFMNLYV